MSHGSGRGSRAELGNWQVKLLVRALSVPVRKDGPSVPLTYGHMTDGTDIYMIVKEAPPGLRF
jgi:hypothetical protein